MKEPDHKVKRHIVPFSNKQKPYWSKHTVHGWLGSGITDCNGVEIFEGDIVRYIPEPGEWNWHEEDKLVVFRNSGFFLIDMSNIDRRETCGATPFVMKNLKDYKVVGHIAEESKQ